MGNVRLLNAHAHRVIRNSVIIITPLDFGHPLHLHPGVGELTEHMHRVVTYGIASRQNFNKFIQAISRVIKRVHMHMTCDRAGMGKLGLSLPMRTSNLIVTSSFHMLHLRKHLSFYCRMKKLKYYFAFVSQNTTSKK
jgi:hypothetical protein